MVIPETCCITAALPEANFQRTRVPLLEAYSRLEPEHWLEYEIDSMSNWLGIF